MLSGCSVPYLGTYLAEDALCICRKALAFPSVVKGVLAVFRRCKDHVPPAMRLLRLNIVKPDLDSLHLKVSSGEWAVGNCLLACLDVRFYADSASG